ncbi:MAG: DUF721 domain-containing protein [Ekhidna sp.]|nr:DUF721 domain-containing protein [Ekhidna sp.]MBC6411346.1 DUF721 domain-containing protein [Ekhidna sp.]MBC6425203.1 DUF721 domain-containing protein [Ekhidna sp.]
MKEDPVKSFRSAFQHFLKEENLEQTFRQKRLIANWGHIMGKTIASRTSKLFFKDKILFIKLTSAPLKNEMQAAKPQILEIIAKELGQGEVVDVRFM